jgi:hypothetical protein
MSSIYRNEAAVALFSRTARTDHKGGEKPTLPLFYTMLDQNRFHSILN